MHRVSESVAPIATSVDDGDLLGVVELKADQQWSRAKMGMVVSVGQ